VEVVSKVCQYGMVLSQEEMVLLNCIIDLENLEKLAHEGCDVKRIAVMSVLVKAIGICSFVLQLMSGYCACL
jgi:hypothetical protein